MIRVNQPQNLACAFLAVAALSGTACAPKAHKENGPPPTAVAPRQQPFQVTFVSSEFKFTPQQVTVPSGRPITLILDNSRGAIEHDLTITDLSFQLRAKAGEVVKGTYTFNRAGTYPIKCSLPGHKESGMTGTLNVRDGAQSGSTQTVKQMASAKTVGVVSPDIATLKSLPAVNVASPLHRKHPTVVPVELEAKPVTALLADGVAYTYWTFNGTVPGPMIRVRQGDTVELTLRNSLNNPLTHSIDSHGVTGPGGGGKVTQTPPGGRTKFRFKALKPGAYIYHCATPAIPQHIARGMYGLMVVEPPQGWRQVDHEYYVMQGDFYLTGDPAQPGMHELDVAKLAAEHPDYVLFNGGVGALAKERALRAQVGETVRIFFGVGGPNLTSSFHAIGEIFDRVYPEAATDFVKNVQTTLVPAGGAAIVEFKLDVPGTYILVDHSLGRLAKGATALLEVEGPPNPQIFEALEPGTSGNTGH